MAIDKITYAASKKYTDISMAGGGAVRGKNCVVDSIMNITGGHRVTFKWTLDNGTVQTGYMDVMDGVDGQDGADGADGLGIKSVDINASNHLIVTYDDNTTKDAGEIKVEGQTIQRNELPTASSDELGKIYQYIGVSDASLTNGYFYQCVVDGTGYKWGRKDVQPVGSGGTVDTELDENSSNPVENKAIAIPVHALQGSMAQFRIAIENLDTIVASKVDKEAGKGLSSNDYTETDKTKVTKLQPIYLIGSGLNLDSDGKLTASGMETPIDNQLDEHSPNPVQNQAIAIPVHALQGSMVNIKVDISTLQASKADKSTTYTKTEVDTLLDAIKNGAFELVSVLPTTDISKSTIYLVPNASHATQNYYDEYICLDDTTTPATWELVGSTQIDLSNYIQKSQTAGLVKNDGSIDQTEYLSQHQDISGKADKVSNATTGNFAGLSASGNLTDSGKGPDDFDSWTPTSNVGADHKVTFDNLEPGLAYKLICGDRIVRIIGDFHKENSTLYPGKLKLTFTTDAPENTVCKLRILK